MWICFRAISSRVKKNKNKKITEQNMLFNKYRTGMVVSGIDCQYTHSISLPFVFHFYIVALFVFIYI